MTSRRDALRILGGVSMACAAGTAQAADKNADSAKKLAKSDAKVLGKADVEAMMQSLSNWGRWGKEDQLGALNLITPAKRTAAAALVKDGVAVSLAADMKTIAGPLAPFTHRMTNLPKEGDEITSAGDEYRVQYHGFVLTHLDALCHLCYKGQMHNGFSQKEVTPQGARKLSVGNVKNGIVTRGVLMDMPRLFGVRFLEGARAIYPDDLEAWEKKSGAKIEGGDALIVRTGAWGRRQVKGEWDIMKDSAGLHASCLPWLKERDVAVVGSDLALDVMPSGIEGFELPVHWVSVVAMGMPILDNCDLEKVSEEAQARKRWAFLLSVAPLAVPAGTGSPVNPLAIF